MVSARDPRAPARPRVTGRPPQPGEATAGLPGACARLAASGRFQAVVVTVILANAATIGLQTYDRIVDRYGDLLLALDLIFLAFFVAELTIRIAAYGRRPDLFFHNGWNVFDFVVIAVAFVPGLRSQATLLRIVRVLRVTRLIGLIPELRIIVRGLLRGVVPMAGVAVLTLLLMYVYAIVGWSLFGDELPERWGTAGRAMLTMFEVLTLEGWNEIFAEARLVTPWATPFFVSFILLGTFVVLNLVIAIVINSVEEARRIELEAEAGLLAASGEAPELADRLLALRGALDELEHALAEALPGGGRGAAGGEGQAGMRPAP
jgi:voltage-gated sodium channel